MEQKKVLCRCAAGHCFLEENEARCGQNYARATNKNGVHDRQSLDCLEFGRLQQMETWMTGLGVQGVCEVICRKNARGIKDE